MRTLAAGIAVAAVISGAAGVTHGQARAAQVARVADSVTLVTADSGNSARYRVREQLVGFDLPNDAVGTTGAVSGTMIIGADGKVSPQSKFTIDVRPLKSDKDRRDGFVQGRLLETAKFPTVTLAPTSVEGVHMPLATSGSLTFTLKGDLTVRGVTKPTTWRVNARFSGKDISGTAETAFTFDDFTITKPRVPVVLSVADTIKLEYDFRFVRK